MLASISSALERLMEQALLLSYSVDDNIDELIEQGVVAQINLSLKTSWSERRPPSNLCPELLVTGAAVGSTTHKRKEPSSSDTHGSHSPHAAAGLLTGSDK